MRRTASSVLRDLEIRVANLEAQASRNIYRQPSDETISLREEAHQIRKGLLEKLKRAGYVIEDDYDYVQNAIKKHPLSIKRFENGVENPDFISELVGDIKRTLGIRRGSWDKRKENGDVYITITDVIHGDFQLKISINTFFPTLNISVKPLTEVR